MSSFRKYPVFASLITLSVIAALGEGWCIYDRWKASRDAAKMFEAKKNELHAMGALAPAPKRDVAAAIEADLARAQHALDAMQAELKGRGPSAERLRTAKVPAARTDAYFDLATFVEKTRELAKAREVELRPEASRFGFALYANEGPEVDRIASVFHQRQIAQFLVESLLEAKPRALISVQREAALTKKEKDDRDATALAAVSGAPPPPDVVSPTLPEGPDFFAIDPRASARVPGYLDATAFRLVFTGQTAALRAFLNKLASFELPVLVREVEVEPTTVADNTPPPPPVAEESGESAPAANSVVLTTAAPKPKAVAAAPKPVGTAPIVAKPWCKFTVTVEYIELVPPAGSEAAAEPAKTST